MDELTRTLFLQVANLEHLSLTDTLEKAKKHRIFTTWYDEIVYPPDFNTIVEQTVLSLNKIGFNVQLTDYLLHLLALDGGGVQVLDIIVSSLNEDTYRNVLIYGIDYRLADTRAHLLDMLGERPTRGKIALLGRLINSESDEYIKHIALRQLRDIDIETADYLTELF